MQNENYKTLYNEEAAKNKALTSKNYQLDKQLQKEHRTVNKLGSIIVLLLIAVFALIVKH